MTNDIHLRKLKEGVKAWNTWRSDNPETRPDLSYAHVTGIDLSAVNLVNANLKSANLSGLKLSYADLTNADLNGADLSWAHLNIADFSDSNLTNTNLRSTDLRTAKLTGAVLDQTDLTKATIGFTIFGRSDLSTAIGLDTLIHRGPSTIGIDTIYRSKGNLSESFLRGAGLPDNFIAYMSSLTTKAFEFYSCFISYSSPDHYFVERLYADLQNKGVRCWFAPEDLKIGDKIRIGIDESIRVHDKLLLVLSANSVASEWVEQEVETALAKEREQKRLMLFPIRLDNSVMEIKSGWPALIKNSRNIGDFTGWKEYGFYQKAFNRLLRDLKLEA